MRTRTGILLALLALAHPAVAGPGEWIPLFNGRDLEGWTPKFAGHPLGENPGRVFRVENGLLKVSYADTERFDGSFGHLFFKTPHSHYRIRAEFRFTGEQLAGGPQWAYRNNGLMLHCQAPETMARDQNFPHSIEAQFWGNNPEKKELKVSVRHMANVYTPGTRVFMDGKAVQNHDSSSPLFSGLDWVTVEVEVRGGEEFIHHVNGREVLRYQDPQFDDGTPLTAGYIAIQAETHPTEFRKLELLPLPGDQTKTDERTGK